MLGFFRIVWTSALTGLDKRLLDFRTVGRSAFRGLDSAGSSGFQVFWILGFRFSVGIVALTFQRCNTFLIGTKPFRPLADYRR
jgi:hypothetical protein